VDFNRCGDTYTMERTGRDYSAGWDTLSTTNRPVEAVV